MSQEALDFLSGYFPAGPWVVVADRESASRAGAWPVCQSSDLDTIRAFVEAHDGRDNLYFPVNACAPNLRTSPTEKDITALLCVPLDVDLPAGHSQDDFGALLARVRSITPPATAIVASGGGIQAHWLTRSPLSLSAAPDVAAQVVALADELGGDHVQNPNRLMRLPGTMNVLNEKKRSLGRVPAPAVLIEADWTRRYDLAAPFTTPPAPGHTPDDIPEPWLDRVRTGSTAWLTGADRSRSAALWRVVLYLVSQEWSDAEIAAVLLDPELGISAHVLHQSRPAQYAARQVRNARLAIEKDYYRRGKEIVSSRIDNIERALAQINVSLTYDEFSAQVQWVNGEDNAAPAELSDHSVTYLRRTILQKEKFQPERTTMWDVCLLVARSNPIHPLREWLDALPPHDGVPRIESWLIRHGQAPDNPYVRAVSKLTLVAAVTRAFAPGVKFDQMLVLENPHQGTDKSRSIRALCPREEWFDDSLQLSHTPKEAIEQLAGKWIVEVQELAGMRSRDVEHLKSFLSRAKDRARLAYARASTEHFRTCVLLGTTNSTQYLRDEENRRFWPVRVGQMNAHAILEERDQMWAEALAAFREGVSIVLPKELWEMAAFEQAARRSSDPWRDEINTALGDIEGKVLTQDIFVILGADRNPALRNQETNQRIGTAMRELGWERTHARMGGVVSWVYARGSTGARTMPITVFRDPVTGVVTVDHLPVAADRHIDDANDDIPF
jgi:predicted P-loop ATPase